MNKDPVQRRILLVDDDARQLRLMAQRLQAQGYAVAAATSGHDALLDLADTAPHLVITDLRMPGMDGIMFMSHLHRHCPGLPVIILADAADLSPDLHARAAMAADVLAKPGDIESLLRSVARHLAASPLPLRDWGIVSRSPLMRALLEDAQKVALTAAAVLISGEPGSGKKTLARALHQASPRAGCTLHAVNPAALTAEQLETFLANGDNAGSLLLDEIGDMPAALQLRLLVLLQQHESAAAVAAPAGAGVRMLSITSQDPAMLLQSGRLRPDLYYRLSAAQLAVPALAQRREDIPLLVAHQLERLGAGGATRRVYAPEAMEMMVTAPWPGNVRQLFNAVEQQAALAPGRVIDPTIVRRVLGDVPCAVPSLEQARDEFTRNYLRQLLELTGGNVSRAARLAGRNRTDFYKLLRRHRVEAPRRAGRAASRSAPGQPASGPPATPVVLRH